MKERQTLPSSKRASIAILILLVAVTISFALLVLRPGRTVSNFEECIQAGGTRMESYPEQCMYKKKTYSNQMQELPKEESYIGMKEEDALQAAKDNNTPARVVERDGEGLPTTMDFVFGRHNLYVKDGAVYKVEIEGQAQDSK